MQWQFESYWLYGLAEPLTGGESDFLEMSHVNGDCFQAFLDSFTHTEHFHIIQLDNASFHTVKKLKIPENMAFSIRPLP